jgi:hypothetical protein
MFGLCLLCATAARAKVEAVAIVLCYDPISTNHVQYTIPTNKTLIIESVCHQQQADDMPTDLCLMIQPGGLGVWFYFGGKGTLPGGYTISLHRTCGIECFDTVQRVIICGKLVDHQDLYAAIPSRIHATTHETGAFGVAVSLASPRPALVAVESSADLITWVRDLAATVAPGATTSNHVVRRPFTGQQGYLRVKARAR